MKILSIYYF